MRVCYPTILALFCILAIAVIAEAVPRKAIIETHLRSFTDSEEASFFMVRKPDGHLERFTVGPVKKNSILRFGSITKIFNAYFGLVNGIDLDASPATYFPESSYPGSSQMTYRDLFNHQSGIPEYATGQKLLNENQTDWAVPGGAFTVQIDIDLAWKNQQLDFTPGSKFCYSNTNYEVTGKTLENLSGKNLDQHLRETFQSTLRLDDGTTKLKSWPQTPAYLQWPYPPTLPGVSGTLIGTAADLVNAFYAVTQSPQFSEMKNWSNVTEKCDAPGASIVGGVKYGLGYQLFSPCQIYGGGATGHDGDLIARSILLDHPSGNIFFYHYTTQINNVELLRRTSILITDYLV